MKIEKYSSLGLDWPIKVPVTPDEFNTMAKRPVTDSSNPVVEVAVDHVIYHDTLGSIRSKFCAEVDDFLQKAERGGERTERGFPADPTVISWDSGRKDADNEQIDLNEAQWFNKVKAATGKAETDFAFLQEKVLADPKCQFDPSVRERQPAAPKKIPQNAMNAANNLIASHGKTEVDGKKLPQPVDVLDITNRLVAANPTAPKPEYEANGMPKAESLARLISANEARKRAQAKLATTYAAGDVG